MDLQTKFTLFIHSFNKILENLLYARHCSELQDSANTNIMKSLPAAFEAYILVMSM